MEQQIRFKDPYEVKYRIKIEDFPDGGDYREILKYVQLLIRENYNIPSSRIPLGQGGVVESFVQHKIEYYYERFLRAYGIDSPQRYPQITSFEVKQGSLLIVFTIQFFDALLMAKDILDFVEFFNKHLESDFAEMLRLDTKHDYTFSFYADTGNVPHTESIAGNGDDEPLRNCNKIPFRASVFRSQRNFPWLNIFIVVFLFTFCLTTLLHIYKVEEHCDNNKDAIKQWIEERIRDEKINSLFYEQYKSERKHIEEIDSIHF